MPNANLTAETLPATVVDGLRQLGEHIAVARKRRRLRQRDLAAKAGISLETMGRIEAGVPTTAIGAYWAVLWTLGLDRHLLEIASPDRDEEGKTLEAARRPQRIRPRLALSNEF